MRRRLPNGAHDALIIAALDAGELTTDPDSGHAWYRGREARTSADGYAVLLIERKPVRAHRAVWIASNGAIPDGLVINHRNGVRNDNRLVNLECVTHRQNALHAQRHPAYVGTYPDEDATISPEFIAQVKALEQRGGATRDELLALVGKTIEPEPPQYGMTECDPAVRPKFMRKV